MCGWGKTICSHLVLYIDGQKKEKKGRGNDSMESKQTLNLRPADNHGSSEL